ncbi:hypothetical protein V8C35DRAFT_315295 [Trichoderma chlorosporum]
MDEYMPEPNEYIPIYEGVEKRSRDEAGLDKEAEPAPKRPALSTWLDSANSQDIDMGDPNICHSPPGNFCSSIPGKFHVREPKSPPRHWDPADTSNWGPFGVSWEPETVCQYIKDSLCKETGGSYWYRMPSSDQRKSDLPNTLHGKSMQDMRLVPNKTFFHINEMIQAKNEKFRWNEEPMFELFARVVHTGCGVNSFESFQSFELEDLFGGQPYMSGLMMFAMKESPIYCESSPFLVATKEDDKCYCLCQVVDDQHAALGRSLNIHDIQPVSWETIRSVHANMSKGAQNDFKGVDQV